MTVEIEQVSAVRRFFRIEAAVVCKSDRWPPSGETRQISGTTPARVDENISTVHPPTTTQLRQWRIRRSPEQVPSIGSRPHRLIVACDCCFERYPCTVRGPSTDQSSGAPSDVSAEVRSHRVQRPRSLALLIGTTKRNPAAVWRESRRTLEASRIRKGLRLDGVIHRASLETHHLKVDVAGDRLKRKACRLPGHRPRDRRIQSGYGDVGNGRSSSGPWRCSPGFATVDRLRAPLPSKQSPDHLGSTKAPKGLRSSSLSRRGSPPCMATTYRSAIPTFS